MTTYTVDQALEILQANEITSSIQMVRRWLRDGKLIGISHGNKRKEGWRIERSALDAFIAMKKATSSATMGVQELQYAGEMLHAVVEALKTENEKIRAENMALMVENEELRKALFSATTNANSEPNELTRDKVETLWANSLERGRYQPHIQKRAYDSLMRLLFQHGSNTTKLHNANYKNPYVCPNTGIKYKSADRLVCALIPRLLTWKLNEEKQYAELVQMREDDYRVYRKNYSQLPSDQLAKMYRESIAYRSNDKKEMVKRSAMVDVLVERNHLQMIGL